MLAAPMPTLQCSANRLADLGESRPCNASRAANVCRKPLQIDNQHLHSSMQPRSHRTDLRCTAAATEEASGTELEGVDMEHWQRCQEKLKEIGFEEEETDKILKKAFGWAGQGYWRKSKVKEVPSAEQIDAVRSFLEGFKFSDSDVMKAVKTFPEVLGLPVEEQLQNNVEKLKKDWKMTDKVIPNVLKRQPALLGFNVDCEGNCQGDCNRCWVRF